MQEEPQDSKILTRMADRNSRRAYFVRRKGCPLSAQDAPKIDYKNPNLLGKYVSEGGRILPSRITGVCPKKQRKLTNAIKVARILALMPYVSN